MHVDNWNPDTYLWILEECDVPYIPEEWAKILTKNIKENKKITGTTVIGRYLSKMRLNNYAEYRWKDTQFLQEMADAKQEEAMKRNGYTAAQISASLQEGRMPMPEKPEELRPPEPIIDDTPDEEMLEMIASLTDADRKHLRLKWGKAYRPDEWIQLEQMWDEMERSYDIQTAGHRNDLKLLCKTNLKANQMLDAGDIESYQRLSKVYDQLMKSGNFQATQNKKQEGDAVNSISEFVLMCEEQGFIPRYYVDKPNDRVDATIQDLKNYTHDLVVEEMNLGNLIENAVQQMVRQENKVEDTDDEDEFELEEKEIFSHGEVEELTEEDFEEYNDFIESEKEDD